MGTRKFLDYDPLTKTTRYFHSDDDRYVIESVQDVEDIINYNARMAEGFNKKADGWFVGCIPLDKCQEWAQESGTTVFTRDWQEYAKKQVQLPEYRKLNPNNIKL